MIMPVDANAVSRITPPSCRPGGVAGQQDVRASGIERGQQGIGRRGRFARGPRNGQAVDVIALVVNSTDAEALPPGETIKRRASMVVPGKKSRPLAAIH